MKAKLRCIGQSILLTFSFVFVVGAVSSAAMAVMEDGFSHIAFISGAAQLLYLAIAAVILKIRKVDIRSRCRIKAIPFEEYLLPALAAVCFSGFSNIVQTIAPIPPTLAGGMSDDLTGGIIAYVTAIFIIAPAVEEFVFRGLIMTKLRKEVSAPAAVIISALLFAAIHLMTGSVITAIHAFFGGVIFALAFEQTGSLFSAVTAHFFGNVGGLVLELLHGCPPVIQCILAAFLAAAAVGACVILVRKGKSEAGYRS